MCVFQVNNQVLQNCRYILIFHNNDFHMQTEKTIIIKIVSYWHAYISFLSNDIEKINKFPPAW